MKFIFRCTASQEIEGTKPAEPTKEGDIPKQETVINTQVGLVSAQPHDDKNHLNLESWDGTSNGKIELGNLNEAVRGSFKCGKEYIVEITEVPS